MNEISNLQAENVSDTVKPSPIETQTEEGKDWLMINQSTKPTTHFRLSSISITVKTYINWYLTEAGWSQCKLYQRVKYLLTEIMLYSLIAIGNILFIEAWKSIIKSRQQKNNNWFFQSVVNLFLVCVIMWVSVS